MSELGKKIATRESYGNALVELGKEHEDLIVLDADLAGATKTGIFKKAFPERHWDIGIAEANMTGIAAGLATCGKVPFISLLRCLRRAEITSRCATRSVTRTSM